MELLLERKIFTDKFTIGQLKINDTIFCDTLEDTRRELHSKKDKIYGQTAIPAGRYRVVLDYSSRYNKIMPHILNVPFFEGIRIHPGNTVNDTFGCILVGEYCNNGQLANSRVKFNALFDLLKKAVANGEDIFIEITD